MITLINAGTENQKGATLKGIRSNNFDLPRTTDAAYTPQPK